MYCPECGAEAGDANFCTECGVDLGDARRRVQRPRHGSDGRKPESRQARRRRQASPQAPASRAAGGLSPVVVWSGIVAVAVVVVLVIVLAGSRGGTGTASAATDSSVRPVAADTSGSYADLVARANGLYDQGSAAFQAQKNAQGTAYFAAAAKVYAAAWKQQHTDAGVGTDYATSLFYSGDVDAAVKQVDKVLLQSPDFQTAWFNKGNYLAQKAEEAGQSGHDTTAGTTYAAARAAYERAISLDKASQVGQQAQQSLNQLPQ